MKLYPHLLQMKQDSPVALHMHQMMEHSYHPTTLNSGAMDLRDLPSEQQFTLGVPALDDLRLRVCFGENAGMGDPLYRLQFWIGANNWNLYFPSDRWIAGEEDVGCKYRKIGPGEQYEKWHFFHTCVAERLLPHCVSVCYDGMVWNCNGLLLLFHSRNYWVRTSY